MKTSIDSLKYRSAAFPRACLLLHPSFLATKLGQRKEGRSRRELRGGGGEWKGVGSGMEVGWRDVGGGWREGGEGWREGGEGWRKGGEGWRKGGEGWREGGEGVKGVEGLVGGQKKEVSL